MNIKIEKNIPIPAKGAKQNKYPIPELQIGDSFCVPLKQQATVRRAAHLHGKKYNKKFTVRTISDKQVRVWRIE